jgi:hypothetical protein
LPEVPRPAKVAKAQREDWSYSGKKDLLSQIKTGIDIFFTFFAATFGCEQGVPLS